MSLSRPASCTSRNAPAAPLLVDELVVNWHLTEACNYGCRYCYAAWQGEQGQRDTVRDDLASARLLEALWQFFRPDNASHPLRQVLRWSNVRLSLAGGEAMLYPQQVTRLARQARALGMRVSLITNGSRLPDDATELASLAQSLDMLGLSLDAFSAEQNRAIGRADRQGRTLSLDTLLHKLTVVRAAQPGLVLKVNTVVNAINVADDLRPALARLRPDRWKVLRMLPVLGQTLAVSDADFAAFVARHASLGPCMSAENNQDMLDSYIMVDPKGRFFQNSTGPMGGYLYSSPITAGNVAQAFGEVPFSAQRFALRYTK